MSQRKMSQVAKNKKIRIEAGSGLQEDEIQRMIRDAEENKEEDKKT